MLELKDVSVVFNEGTVNEKVALNNINLALDKGDFVTIIGSNGAGKSTLFQAISGAVDTKRGNIIFQSLLSLSTSAQKGLEDCFKIL